MESIKVNFLVDEIEQGSRLDKFLATKFQDISRAKIQESIKTGKIQVNNNIVKSRFILSQQDNISGEIDFPILIEDKAEHIDLDIIYKDEHIIIINKPAGLVTHPAVGNHTGTLLNALLHHFPENSELPRAGIVHRLDKDTSGIMVVAHNMLSHNSLIEQLQNRSMGREYLTIVHGNPTAGQTIDEPIGRCQQDRLKMAIRADGKPAITHFSIEEKFKHFSLLRVKLETGRTHQIRVHLTAKRFPLIGDQLYAKNIKAMKNTPIELRNIVDNFPRQALHAQKLHLFHPQTKEKIEFNTEPAADFAQLLSAIRKLDQ